MNQLIDFARSFAKEEDGAQILEYALIVAVVSLGLIGLIQTKLLDTGAGFTDWLDRVVTCLGGTCGA